MYEKKDGVCVSRVLKEPQSKTYEAVSIQWLDGLYDTLKDVPEAAHLFSDVTGGKIVQGVHVERYGKQPLEIVREGVIRFAHYLDGFNTLTQHLEIMALYKAREIDREFMLLMIDEIGLEKAKELARQVQNGHKHTKFSEPTMKVVDGVVTERCAA